MNVLLEHTNVQDNLLVTPTMQQPHICDKAILVRYINK